MKKLKKLRDERLNKKVSLSTFDLELQMGVKAKRKLDKKGTWQVVTDAGVSPEAGG